MNKTYIEFFYPGSFVSETSTKEVPNRDDPKEIPAGAYGYQFFDRTEVTQDGELLLGQRKNYSGMTYFGEVMTTEDVEKKVPDNRILLSNMRCNGWDRVVRTVRGNFQSLKHEDRVIAAHQQQTKDK